MDRAVWLDAVQAAWPASEDLVAEIAREPVGRCRELTARINQLHRQLQAGRVAGANPAGAGGLGR